MNKQIESSVVSNSEAPWTAAFQVPLSVEFSRQEYWSGLPFPTTVDFSNPGIKLASPVSPVRVGIFSNIIVEWKEIVPRCSSTCRFLEKKMNCEALASRARCRASSSCSADGSESTRHLIREI